MPPPERWGEGLAATDRTRVKKREAIALPGPACSVPCWCRLVLWGKVGER